MYFSNITPSFSAFNFFLRRNVLTQSMDVEAVLSIKLRIIKNIKI